MPDFNIENAAAYINKLTEAYFQCGVRASRKIGEGYYGAVYLVETDKDPKRYVVKWYKYEGHHVKQAEQMRLLRAYARLPVSEVYHVHSATDDIPLEALLMEYMEGEMASGLRPNVSEAAKLADSLVDQLIAWHEVSNPAGYGDIGGPLQPSWKVVYRGRIDEHYRKLRHVSAQHIVSSEVMRMIDISYEAFDRIFAEEPKRSSLVHGDYNLWNVLVDPQTYVVRAIIDPSDAGWADREMDLFHLQQADGDRFGLLDNYRSKAALSEHFAVKHAFYRFWDDLKHLLYCGWYDELHFRQDGGLLLKEIERM